MGINPADSEKREGQQAVPKLVFFFSGKKLPTYAKDALAIASRNFSGQIVLLTDSPAVRSQSHFLVENYLDWFDPHGFQLFARKTPLDSGFRDGFWHKAVLRFFVLEQFMKVKGLDRLVHMELDVAFLGLSELPDALDQFGRGVFVPWLTPRHGIASFIYVNDVKDLSNLVRSFTTNAHLGHEMALLGKALQTGQGTFGLPTTGTLAMIQGKIPLPNNQIPPSSSIGIFDAAPIGHWLLGQDARNQRGQFVRNHFIFDYVDDSKRDFLSLAPRFVADPNGLRLYSGMTSYSISCLHVHSKALYLVRNPFAFRWVVAMSRKSKPTVLPIVPRITRWRDSRLRRNWHVFLVRVARLLRGDS